MSDPDGDNDWSYKVKDTTGINSFWQSGSVVNATELMVMSLQLMR